MFNDEPVFGTNSNREIVAVKRVDVRTHVSSGNTVHDIGPNKLHGVIHGHPTWEVSVSKPVLDPSNVEKKHPKP